MAYLTFTPLKRGKTKGGRFMSYLKNKGFKIEKKFGAYKLLGLLFETKAKFCFLKKGSNEKLKYSGDRVVARDKVRRTRICRKCGRQMIRRKSMTSNRYIWVCTYCGWWEY